jgi:hypothetical protein
MCNMFNVQNVQQKFWHGMATSGAWRFSVLGCFLFIQQSHVCRLQSCRCHATQPLHAARVMFLFWEFTSRKQWKFRNTTWRGMAVEATHCTNSGKSDRDSPFARAGMLISTNHACARRYVRTLSLAFASWEVGMRERKSVVEWWIRTTYGRRRNFWFWFVPGM